MEYDYEYFKAQILKITGIDLNCYKEKQMKRRIDALILTHGIDGYRNYIEVLKSDKALFEEFISYITINVSEFYRNPEQWKYMEKDVLPELMTRFGKRLKIWSAACSTGDEPYSLVLLLSKYLPLSQIDIYATDLDKQILEKAKTGLYTEKSIEGVPADLKEKYFTQIGQSYKVADEIKKRVKFAKQDLLKDIYPKDCNMIVCRNVVIYFTDETKGQIFRKFYDSLLPGGVLFIGSTEQIMDYREIGFERMNSFFYRKKK